MAAGVKMGPRILLLVGLPGSGKSSWAAGQGTFPLSSDGLRVVLADDETAQGIHQEVFAALRYLLTARLKLGRPLTIVDATHLAPWEREPYFALAKEHGATVEAVFFDVPLAECKRRNRRRGRQVPEEVLEAMAAKLVAPTEAEGFSRITVVRPGAPNY